MEQIPEPVITGLAALGGLVAASLALKVGLIAISGSSEAVSIPYVHSSQRFVCFP